MLKETTTQPPLWKLILFVLGCIAIFVIVAVSCNLLTSWISNSVIKVTLRELMLRIPFTIILLHLFASRVIKTYDPQSLYSKATLVGCIKWIGIGLILPLSVYLIYSSFYLITPFRQTVSLTNTDTISIIIKWLSISFAAGITEAILFRGHLVMVLKSRYSDNKSIVIAAFIFGFVHLMYLTEVRFYNVAFVLIGGTIAGIMFSTIYRYTKVIWYSAMVHSVWDVFFIGKITMIANTQVEANQAILPYRLETQKLLLTGGNFGLESSLPSMMIYLTVILIIYSFSRKNLVTN